MTAVRKLDPDYLALIERWPLIPITRKSQLKRASQILSELARRSARLTTGERNYFRALGILVADYEARIYPKVTLSPREALAGLIEENNLSLTDLERAGIAARSNLSAFLSGRRGLSKESIRRLAAYFKVSTELFTERI